MSPTSRVVAIALSALVFSACNCAGNTEIEETCKSNAQCSSGSVCINGICKKSVDGGTGDGGNPVTDGGNPDSGTNLVFSALALEPATCTLTSKNGSKPTQTFAARASFTNGSSVLADNVVYSADNEPIGTIEPITGVFTASAQVGGVVKVKGEVTINGVKLSATQDCTVQLEWEVVDPALPTGAAAKFTTTPILDPLREATIAYPLPNVVFPQNVFPADIQWLTATAGDFERVTITKPNAKVVAYVLEAGDKHWLAQAQGWRAVAQTDPGVSAALAVDRFEASTQQVITGTPQQMRFARSALAGSVYYWDIGAGRILRINDGTNTRTSFLPAPPVAMDGSRCVGCHTVGASGRYMSGRLGGGENIGGVFDLTANLTGDPAPTIFPTIPTAPTSARWWFSSFNPDESRMVVSIDEGGAGGMAFLNANTGAYVTVPGTPVEKVTHVAWAPDGKTIAYVNHLSNWGGDSTTGDINTIPVPAPDTLGTPTLVHTGASLSASFPAGSADSYPTWSPDSKRIAFANGTGNRSEFHYAALYWMTPTGTEVTRLTNASGGATGQLNYQPRFSPFISDGYYWMSFLSRRDYGNEKVGTKGASRQQVWVAAVKVNPTAGTDPSEVGYWLPGQDTASRNIAAFWAPLACRKQNEGCTVGSECCSNVCAANPQGALVCSPPPPDRCRLQGESCSATGDCCAGKGLVCQQNVCAVSIN